jgi:hypothetical protein
MQLPAPPRNVESLDYQYLETGFVARSETAERFGKTWASFQLQMLLSVLELKYP